MSRQRRLSLALLGALGVGAVGGAFFVRNYDGPSLSYANDSRQSVVAREDLKHATSLSEAFRGVAKTMRPSVVSISAVKINKPALQQRGSRPGMQQPQIPEEFKRFFGDDFEERFGGQFNLPSPGQEQKQQGLGTGVIVSKDGYILTNNHVAGDADEVEVTLSDHRTFEAKVVGADAKTDIAVLKIEASDLVPAVLGNSDHIEVGDWVVAVGTPFGLEQTVTSGIISAKGRADVGITEYEDFIQTDAAINPGNSGGPLVNMHGEVIGINTAIASRSGGFMGVGFAIPSNMVKQVTDAIIADGKVARGWLGASIQNLSKDLAHSFGYKSTDGVLIGQVIPGSPAEKSGLKAGDIVTEFAGKKQHSASSLRNQVAGTKPETPVEMKVFRDGREVKLNITLGLLDEKTVPTSLPNAAEVKPEATALSELGLKVETLTPEVAKELKLDEQSSGAVISEVASGSVAQENGLRQGDVILSVNGSSVKTAEEFAALAKKADLSKGIRLQVASGGYQRFVFLKS